MRKKKLSLKDRLIICLDTSSKRDVISMCSKISGRVSTLKLGLELIYSVGPEVVSTVKSFGYKVMLDAKLLDIPNTVVGAIRAIGKLDVDIITIHALGGRKMLEEAVKVLDEQSKNKIRPLLFGVTILTSLDDEDLKVLGFKGNFVDSVLNLINVSREAGLDGIVCSPREVEKVRKVSGSDFYIATPGIRLAGDAPGDQKRISTPFEAMSAGADFIIAGRSITAGKDIEKTIDLYMDNIRRALES